MESREGLVENMLGLVESIQGLVECKQDPVRGNGSLEERRDLCLGKLEEVADCEPTGEAPPPKARAGLEQNSSWPGSCLGLGRPCDAALPPKR